MTTIARPFVALVMTLSLVGSGAVLQSGDAAPAGAAPDLHAKIRVCSRHPEGYGEMKARGVRCKRAKNVMDTALGRLRGTEGRRITIQNFRCVNRYEFAPDIVCRGKREIGRASCRERV